MYRPISSILAASSKRFVFQSLSSPSSLSTLRCYSTESTEKTPTDKPTTPEKSRKSKSKKKDEGSIFDPRYVGLRRDTYIPISWKNFPNPITSPKLAWRSLARRVYMFGLNTIQVGLLRYQGGVKPKFLLWKNNAIENYVQVNKYFANKNVPKISNKVSIWVEQALTARVESIPKNVRLDWRLVKFNETPKLISIKPFMLPGKPMEYVEIVYKFNTNQELIKVNLDSEKTSKISRDVIDYVGFIVDLHTNETCLSGSVFENSPYDKIPKSEDVDESQIFKDMRANGDLFRLPPSNQPNNSKISSKE